MKKFILIFYFSLLASYLHSQTVYTIPWATVQPKFVFPIYFEEATGMRDTLYICYDSLAHTNTPNMADTIFGQKLIYTDTTKFYAYFPCCCNINPFQCDSQYKATVSPLGGTGQFPISWIHFGFRNGILPLKMSWDILTLYSDSLPFPLNTGLPRAQGRFNTLVGSPFIKLSENGQVIDPSLPYDLLLSDTGSNRLRDSCTVFSIDGNSHPVEEVVISPMYFEQWTGTIPLVESFASMNDFIIFPNPCNKQLTLKSRLHCEKGALRIFDMTGKIVLNIDNLNLEEKNELPLKLSSGVFIVNFTCSQYLINRLLLIVN